MSFYRDRWVKKTKKVHRCIWCNGLIEAGSRSCYSSGTWEGDFWADHFHPECAAARDAVASEYGEWTADGDYARGRMDDDRTKPPEFTSDYTGKTIKNLNTILT